MGHSRGGGLVSLKAAENKKNHPIDYVGQALPIFGARFPTGAILEKMEKKRGVGLYRKMHEHSNRCRTTFSFYENFKANEERLTIREAVSKLKIPHLIVHGTNDTSVELKEGEYLHQWNAK